MVPSVYRVHLISSERFLRCRSVVVSHSTAKASLASNQYENLSLILQDQLSNNLETDVTKTITLDVVYGGTIKDPWGNTKAGFKISGEVNRFDYNLKWNNLLETGGAVVGKTVKINCFVELTKEK